MASVLPIGLILSCLMALYGIGNSSTIRQRCEPLESSLCKGLGYKQTAFSPITQLAIEAEILEYQELIGIECSPFLHIFLCYSMLPRCNAGLLSTIKPCKSVCRRMQRDCGAQVEFQLTGWPQALSCERYSTKSDSNCLNMQDIRKVNNFAQQRKPADDVRNTTISNKPTTTPTTTTPTTTPTTAPTTTPTTTPTTIPTTKLTTTPTMMPTTIPTTSSIASPTTTSKTKRTTPAVMSPTTPITTTPTTTTPTTTTLTTTTPTTTTPTTTLTTTPTTTPTTIPTTKLTTTPTMMPTTIPTTTSIASPTTTSKTKPTTPAVMPPTTPKTALSSVSMSTPATILSVMFATTPITASTTTSTTTSLITSETISSTGSTTTFTTVAQTTTPQTTMPTTLPLMTNKCIKNSTNPTASPQSVTSASLGNQTITTPWLNRIKPEILRLNSTLIGDLNLPWVPRKGSYTDTWDPMPYIEQWRTRSRQISRPWYYIPESERKPPVTHRPTVSRVEYIRLRGGRYRGQRYNRRSTTTTTVDPQIVVTAVTDRTENGTVVNLNRTQEALVNVLERLRKFYIGRFRAD